MSIANWVRSDLEEKGVPYHALRHAEAFTAQALAERLHVSGHRVAKVVVVMADGRPVELVLPATRRVVLEWVQAVLGADEVRLATEEELAGYFPDCEVGALPALRHWKGVDVLMDAFMDVGGEVVFQGGTHHDAVRLPCADWVTLLHPRLGRFTEPLHP